jgi:hypothetical protein
LRQGRFSPALAYHLQDVPVFGQSAAYATVVVDNIIVYGDLEYAAVAFNQVGRKAEAALYSGRQTGGQGQVASFNAVCNVYNHIVAHKDASLSELYTRFGVKGERVKPKRRDTLHRCRSA